jgi:hypothetical protein
MAGQAEDERSRRQSGWLDEDARALIRERVDLRELVAEHVELRRAGGDRYVGRCPFHAEKTGSFTVWADHAYCFGCQWRGDVFAFVMHEGGISFSTALAELARRADVPLATGARPRPLGPTPRQRAVAERQAAFDQLRTLWATRAAITADFAGFPRLEAWALKHELPEIAARETELIARFYSATITARGEIRTADSRKAAA